MTMAFLRAILLDLDDTLIVNDMDAFGSAYFQALTKRMSAICPPVRFVEALQAGTHAMLHNDGRAGTNADVFLSEFLPRAGIRAEDALPLFDRFYREDFEALRPTTSVDPDARRLVMLARQEGYQLAVATQPVFPRQAILARLRWADVPDEEFRYDLISSYETFSACKPQRLFFQTIVERLQRRPDECLMVGDSLEADMPAARYGLKTFWVDRGQESDPPKIEANARGTLADLIRLLETRQLDAC